MRSARVISMTGTPTKTKKYPAVTLNSQQIRKVQYSPESRKLTVWNGPFTKTVHPNISQGMYDNLISAGMPDFYYSHYIVADQPAPKSAFRKWLILLLLLALVIAAWVFG